MHIYSSPVLYCLSFFLFFLLHIICIVCLEEERGLVEVEILRMDVVTNELERTILLEEVSWRQKLRALWLREVISAQNSSIEWPFEKKE